MNEQSNLKRHQHCPMRTHVGNCLIVGGFCTSIREDICDALHQSFQMGTRNCAVDKANKEKERIAYKPIRIDGFTEKCPKCGEKVMYAVGTGTMFHGASESYEDWRVIKHDYCPRCGTKMEREGADDE